MQVTIEIPDAIAQRLRSRGETPETYLHSLVMKDEEQVPTPTLTPAERAANLARFFDQLAQSSDKFPQLPDYAFTRESFYEDHD